MKDKILIRNSLTIKACLAFFALTVSACGFEPVYGQGSTVKSILNDIEVAQPSSSRESYLLVRELEFQFGRNSLAGNELQHSISVAETGFETAGSHVQLIGTVQYGIVDRKRGGIIASGSVQNFVSFESSENLLSVSRNDATKKLMSNLAVQIKNEIIGKITSTKP